MLLSNYPLSEPHTLISIDECSHLASSSLNSMEYLTAATLGVAKDFCEATSNKSMIMLQSNRSLSAADFLSISQRIILSDFRDLIAHINEIVHDYFEYVDTDLGRTH